MKYTFVFLMALAACANVEPCGLRQDGTLCLSPHPGTEYLLASSDLRQIKCVPEAPSQDTNVFHLAYAKRGVRYNCAEIKQSDSEFDPKFEYPPKPDSYLDLKGTHSYAHMESNEKIVNCFQSPAETTEAHFSASKSFFPVIDLKNGINYVCMEADKQPKGFADRVARAFSSSCDDVNPEG